jgi:DNA-binding beta-propeller fold protein YncE
VFDLVTTNYRSVKWTFDGPLVDGQNDYISEGRVAISPSGTTVYKMESDTFVVIDKKTGVKTAPPLPPDFPKFSWPMDVVYDTKRNYVSIVSLGGDGYFYRFDAAKNAWLDVKSVNNIDFCAMAYDAASDIYVAWSTDNKLYELSANGGVIRYDDITDDLWGWKSLTGDKKWMNMHVVSLAGVGQDVAIIAFDGNQVKRIWRYNRTSLDASTTFRKGWLF